MKLNDKTKLFFRETVESIVVALILALAVRTFLVQAFKIPTGSMRPTLLEGDRILVNKFIYRFKDPDRGDVVVFKYPEDPKRDFIKRLVGKGNEEILIRGGRIIVNGEEAADAVFGERYYYNQGPFGVEGKPLKIPSGQFFVLGDNSVSSRDSRFWGFVPKRNLVGKAFFVYWPLNRVRMIR